MIRWRGITVRRRGKSTAQSHNSGTDRMVSVLAQDAYGVQGCVVRGGNAGFGGLGAAQRTVGRDGAPSDRVEAEITVASELS